MNSHSPQFGFVYELRDKNGNVKRTINREERIFNDELTLRVKTKSGVIINEKTIPLKSFVRNFGYILNYIYMAVTNQTTLLVTTTGGATNPGADVYTMAVNEGALSSPTQSLFGIWIGDMDDRGGDGLTAEAGIGNIVAFGDYMLRRKILPDGGAPDTNVEYRATNVSISGNILTISRRFQNDDTTDKYIDEIGLVGKQGTNYVLICRDVLTSLSGETEVDSTVILEPTEVLEVEYKFQVTPSSGLTKNWLRALSSDFVAGNAVEQLRDITNSAKTVNLSTARTQKDLNAGANIDTHGIVIGGYPEGAGVGILPFSTDDFNLGTKLSDANVDHGPMTTITPTTTSGYTTIGMYRDFENDRADNKTLYILESGLYMKEASGGNYFLIARNELTNLDPDYIAVAKDEILRVKAFLKLKLIP